jgi:two-component system phosphate regulon sensor histidine kinase PhoR
MGAAGELPSSQQRLLDAIRRNADRLKTLVDDLLDISWIEAGQSDLKREEIGLSEIIENEINDHVTGRIQHEGKSIDFVLDLEPDLPPVFADPEKVTRIIMNLVDNAINYTPDGGEVTVRARVRIDNEGASAVEMKITDTGVGIGQQHLERIFERFYRVEDGTIQETPGTGLGLSIVRSLVEMHGGEIAVESELGVGSTFTVLLPCSDDWPQALDLAHTITATAADSRTET